MARLVKSPYGNENVEVVAEIDEISLWQSKDLILLFDAKMARKLIKAIRKEAKKTGWEV